MEKTTSDKLGFILARCKCSVTLTVNDHRNVYLSVADKIKEENDIEAGVIPPDLAARMITAGTIVELQFYPDTAIGFYRVYGASLDEVLTKAVEVLKEEP